jgi:hypothetical protein
MSANREFDMIIFGATGFTGKYVFKNVMVSSQIERKDWKLAISGRNESKLNSVIDEISAELEQDLKHVVTVVADVEDESSLYSMAKRTKLILNTVGPYSLWGEPVVKACLKVIKSSLNLHAARVLKLALLFSFCIFLFYKFLCFLSFSRSFFYQTCL